MCFGANLPELNLWHIMPFDLLARKVDQATRRVQRVPDAIQIRPYRVHRASLLFASLALAPSSSLLFRQSPKNSEKGFPVSGKEKKPSEWQVGRREGVSHRHRQTGNRSVPTPSPSLSPSLSSTLSRPLSLSL